MDRISAMELLDQARQADMDLTNLPAVSVTAELLEGYTTADDSTLWNPSMAVIPRVHPYLEALFETSGATRRGAFTWSFGLGEHCNPTLLARALDHAAPGTVYAGGMTQNARGPADLTKIRRYNKWAALQDVLAGTPAYGVVTDARVARVNYDHPLDRNHLHGAISVSTDGRSIYVKVITHQLDKLWGAEGPLEGNVMQVPLDLRAAGRNPRDPWSVRPAEAFSILAGIAELGIEIADPFNAEDLTVLRRKVSSTFIAWPTRGRPAEATSSVGARIAAQLTELVDVPTDRVNIGASLMCTVDASDVASAASTLGELAVIHPAVLDTSRLASALPVVDEDLRPYQCEIVGLHTATEIGFVNTIEPGMGKTVTTLKALELRAATRKSFRALVVVEAATRAQWEREAARWAPDFTVFKLTSSNDVGALIECLAAAGTDPVLVVSSYGLLNGVAHLVDNPRETTATTVSAPDDNGQFNLFAFTEDDAIVPISDEERVLTLADVLLDTHWNDIVADEATVLRSTGAKAHRALWELRENADVAVALTGTPINRGLDDLGRLLSWVRNDRDLFKGCRLDVQFPDLSNPTQLDAYMRAIGPLVYRRDKSEISAEMPDMNPQVIELTPSREELALANAAQHELRRVYEELLSWVKMMEGTAKDSAEYKDVLESLVAARGAWLGGTQLARMASSDPVALRGSQSAGAELLAAQGLVDAACAAVGTKRAWCIPEITGRVQRGQQVLVFTEFATVAHGLIADLHAAGVRVGAVLGGGGKARDMAIDAYRAGDLDVLICTSAAERGLNLQCTDCIIHYDLPWVPERIIQRNGRVERIGSTVDAVDVLFPIMIGTIEERVAALVVSRAIKAMQALDGSRGVNVAATDMGRALGGLAAAADSGQLRTKGEAVMLTVTREILAA